MKEEVFIDVFSEDEKLIPKYETLGAVGADLRADLKEDILLPPGESCCVPTGLYLEIPVGYEAQIRPRSGLALKNVITVLNTPGTVDSDFRGEVCVILINHGKKVFKIEPKRRIAQIVFKEVLKVSFVRRKKLKRSKRGSGGFGHTGTN
jgi:dUTP pyrophosphatase